MGKIIRFPMARRMQEIADDHAKEKITDKITKFLRFPVEKREGSPNEKLAKFNALYEDEYQKIIDNYLKALSGIFPGIPWR